MASFKPREVVRILEQLGWFEELRRMYEETDIGKPDFNVICYRY